MPLAPHLQIRPFVPEQAAAVLDLILGIQRDEFQLPITAEDQPDLAKIPSVYQVGAGQFWVGLDGEEVVGTIALLDFGRAGALRKMFVRPGYRGKESGLAQALLDTLLAHARSRGLEAIYLGTIGRFHAALRFYERNGFRAVPAAELPAEFPRVAIDHCFYGLDLRGDGA